MLVAEDLCDHHDACSYFVEPVVICQSFQDLKYIYLLHSARKLLLSIKKRVTI